jgi:uncharacterized membrane protein (UPF0127 family)
MQPFLNPYKARNRMVLIAALALLMTLLSATGFSAEPAALLRGFDRDQLVIETAGGSRKFEVYVATTNQQRAQGLMFVKSMDAGEGMIFLYPETAPVTMWMKNTFIPLDMLFIGTDNRIVRVHANAIPHSTNTIESGGTVTAVVELNTGSIKRFGISAGDRVVFPAGQESDAHAHSD